MEGQELGSTMLVEVNPAEILTLPLESTAENVAELVLPTTRSLVSFPRVNKRSFLLFVATLLICVKPSNVTTLSSCPPVPSERRRRQLSLTNSRHRQLALVELVHLPSDFLLLRQPILLSPSSFRILGRSQSSLAASYNLRHPHLDGQQSSAETDRSVDGCWSSYASASLYTSGDALVPIFLPNGSTTPSSALQALPRHLTTTPSNGSPKTPTTNTPSSTPTVDQFAPITPLRGPAPQSSPSSATLNSPASYNPSANSTSASTTNISTPTSSSPNPHSPPPSSPQPPTSPPPPPPTSSSPLPTGTPHPVSAGTAT